MEEHEVDGQVRKLFAHRKGTTRAFGPGHLSIPEAMRPCGQPVLIGRSMSRHAALRRYGGKQVAQELEAGGILFAKNIGATVVGLHVILVPHEDRLEAWMHHDPHHPERAHCDLIDMASHGWKGDETQLPGCVTLKVLHHCKVPGLVHKPARERTHVGVE